MKRRSPIPARPYSTRVPLELASRKAIKQAAEYAFCTLAVFAIVYLSKLLYQVGGRP